MEKIINEKVYAEFESSSLTICKGYGYVNKDGKQRYSVNDEYYQKEDGSMYRMHSNDNGDFFYKVDLIDVVVETYAMKDGSAGSKTYPLSETPYLEGKNSDELKTYLMFKNHR